MQQPLQKYTFSENKVFTASWMEGRKEKLMKTSIFRSQTV